MKDLLVAEVVCVSVGARSVNSPPGRHESDYHPEIAHLIRQSPSLLVCADELRLRDHVLFHSGQELGLGRPR